MNLCRCLTVLFLFIALQSGCATVQPGLRASTFNNGTPDPDRDEEIEKRAKELKEAPDVDIFAGKIPAGLDVTEGGNKITIAQGYEGKYEILGTIESDYTKGNNWAAFKNLYWTWNYAEGWRKGLCWPQAPLKAATLGIWNILPWSWPCFASIPREEKDRQKAHLNQIKKLAAAMGADMVVLTNSGDLAITTVNARSGAIVGHSISKNMSLKGFAVRRKGGLETKSLPAVKTQTGD